jgi:triosephosphate isomerase
MRRLIIAGNWKMHKNSAEAAALVRGVRESLRADEPGCEVIVGPPFTSIPAAVDAARGSVIKVAAQNLHWEDSGAYTGEIAGGMLKEAGCSHVIIGHSERRQFFGETDETVNRRIAAALRHGLVPIVCIGETLEERENGATFDVLRSQLVKGLRDITVVDPVGFVIAYEPVWAIGTGKTATPDQAQEAHAFVRKEVGALLGTELSESIRILYGGSMKPANSKELAGCKDIDGGLIGGASLQAEDFVGIIREAV